MAEKVNHIGALTGLRFLAAFAVFLHHVAGHFGIPHCPMPLGAIGVSFFFVLSGFILVYVYQHRLKSTSDIPKFYFTRWARIWPLHFVCLVLFFFFLSSFSHAFHSSDNFWKLIANLFLLQSWIPSSQWAFAFNSVSWSISTEFFFYLAFPLLLLASRRRFWQLFVGLGLLQVLAVIGVQWYCLQSGPTHGIYDVTLFFHFNPIVRGWEFMAGMAVGRYFLKQSAEAPQEIPLVERYNHRNFLPRGTRPVPGLLVALDSLDHRLASSSAASSAEMAHRDRNCLCVCTAGLHFCLPSRTVQPFARVVTVCLSGRNQFCLLHGPSTGHPLLPLLKSPLGCRWVLSLVLQSYLSSHSGCRSACTTLSKCRRKTFCSSFMKNVGGKRAESCCTRLQMFSLRQN